MGEEQIVRILDAARGEHQLAHLAQAVARIVLVPRLLQDGVDVHARELQRDSRVGRIVADMNFADLRRPLPQTAEHERSLLTLDRRDERAVVERRQTPRGQRLERLDLGHQGGEKQRFRQPGVVAEGDCALIGDRQRRQRFFADAVLLFEQRPQLADVEALRVLEVLPHPFAERLVAFGDHVEEITHGNQVAQLQRVALAHQQLQHDLERGALALQQRRDGDQDIDERG